MNRHLDVMTDLAVIGEGVDYNKKKGTPIGDHIDRVGQVFYEAA